MSSKRKTVLRTQVKLLVICLMAELTFCGLMNSARLHFIAATDEISRDLGWLTTLYLAGSMISLNIVSLVAAVLAVVRKLEHRPLAIVSIPMTLAVTVLIAAMSFFWGAQGCAAVALSAYLLAMAVISFVPGKIWPPDGIY